MPTSMSPLSPIPEGTALAPSRSCSRRNRQDRRPVDKAYKSATLKAMGCCPRCFRSEMTVAPSLGPTPCPTARGPSASRRGLPSRAKSALSAAVAMGIMGLTTGCQSDGTSTSSTTSPSQSTSTSQVQPSSPTQSQSVISSSATQIQSPTQTSSPTQSPAQNPTQIPSSSPIQSPIPSASLGASPFQSLIPSPSQSASAPPITPPSSGLAFAASFTPDPAEAIIPSEINVPGVDPTLPVNLLPDVVQGAPATQAAPGPLPIFGAAAAFGASRQLRKRIKTSAPPNR